VPPASSSPPTTPDQAAPAPSPTEPGIPAAGPAPAAPAGAGPAPNPRLADPYAISEAKPSPQPGPGPNPYRGPGPATAPAPAAAASLRERPTYAAACPPGADCKNFDVDYSYEAVRASPFVQMLSGAFHLRERVSSAVAFGGEVGGFVLDRFRGSVRALVPVSDVTDQANDEDASAWLWGVSLGVAADRQSGFVLSPSLQYLGIVGGDYGHTLGIHVPFEWLGRSGLRIGFDFAMLYGFGGTYTTNGNTVEERPNSAGFTINLLVGHAFAFWGE